jgi:hypothetical protein
MLPRCPLQTVLKMSGGAPDYLIDLTSGGCHEPSMIEGGISLVQYLAGVLPENPYGQTEGLIRLRFPFRASYPDL